MTEFVTITKQYESSTEVCIYDVCIEGVKVDFSASVDEDNDIRIELDENSVFKALKDNYTKEYLKEQFNIE